MGVRRKQGWTGSRSACPQRSADTSLRRCTGIALPTSRPALPLRTPPLNRRAQSHFREGCLLLRVQSGIPRTERRVIRAEPGPLAPAASHGRTVHRSPGPLTAGTSGPPARTCTHRCQSAATGCEASSSPASPWWPRPRRRRETGAEPRKSREAERTLVLLTGGTQGGRRAPVQGWVTATVHPPVRVRRHAAASLITHRQRRDYFMRVLDKTVTPACTIQIQGK